MNTFSTQLGWLFLSLFALGLTARFSRRFYPESQGFTRRLAAPLIFASLAWASFQGLAIPALLCVIALGVTQILLSRRNKWRRKERS